MARLLEILLGSVLLIGIVAAVDYENPVQSSAEDEIKSLPYLNVPITFRQYSGYLNADKKGKAFLHYWFVEATEDPANKPVLLWLNGGPGCSSMEGLFSELGPFQLDESGTHVSLREYSWNKLANVIFLESPTQVGYSYGLTPFDIVTDDSAAMQNYLALKSFYEKFPQYKKNNLYLSGESYAGVYLPTLGVLVDADKEFNLKGIAIGNGYLDAQKLDESLVFFAYYHGLLGKSDWDEVSRLCCDGKAPARENCNFKGRDAHLACKLRIFQKINSLLRSPGFNPYNIYGDCPTSNLSTNARSRNNRWSVDRAIATTMLNRRASDSDDRPFEILNVEGVEPPCFDGDNMVRYMNDPKVREAIHIPKHLGQWDACTLFLRYVMKYPIRPGGLAPQIQQLIKSERKLGLLIFNGDTDMVCNTIGDEWFTDDLGRKVISDYQLWHVGKQVAGFVKHYDGITFATVRGAGHMVPEFRPKEAFAMIGIVLNSTSHNVFL